MAPPLERDFYRTLALLKSRDPRIYRPETTFYNQHDSSSGSEEEEKKEKKEKKQPLFLKDYERKVVLEKEGKYVDEEDEEDEEAAAKRKKLAASPQLHRGAEGAEGELPSLRCGQRGGGGGGGGGSALLRPRSRTAEEKVWGGEDYVQWLKGQGGPAPPRAAAGPGSAAAVLVGPGAGSRGAIPPRLHPRPRIPRRLRPRREGDEGAPPDSSDEGELFLARQEDFERRFNFRFEEPGAEQVQTFPRRIPTSVRRRDERRKERRERLKEKKKKARLRAHEELKQLKNLRRAALAERLRLLREASGDADLPLPPDLLRGDFDPARHDRAMAECFGEEYYGLEEAEKPQFEEEEEEEDNWNWDSWPGRAEDSGGAQQEPHCEDPDFVMDADYEEGAPPKRRPPPALGKRRRKSRFREALEREKPQFDPAAGPFERYVDEFYSLDYEDLIGDLPCRFKYRSVVPCDFGLTTEEILAADDKELNRWCSLRKTCMYRSEQEERQDQANYSRRARDGRKKLLILKSLAEGPEPPPPSSLQAESGEENPRQTETAGKRGGRGAPPTPKPPTPPKKASAPPLRPPKVWLGGGSSRGGAWRPRPQPPAPALPPAPPQERGGPREPQKKRGTPPFLKHGRRRLVAKRGLLYFWGGGGGNKSSQTTPPAMILSGFFGVQECFGGAQGGS
ncbi:LOW QUALITY PROTEIN: protein KRI1 homolog [Phaenicophaeus curvirostris]|uniref:LOW QUALITY PROTEIN: protein KRI1 homolog n=1 Tax=Phaenicophaeus curvirostris TaxID=33595 RepID=UPI0037F0DD90